VLQVLLDVKGFGVLGITQPLFQGRMMEPRSEHLLQGAHRDGRVLGEVGVEVEFELLHEHEEAPEAVCE
jgi:hypothetical protein